MANRGYYTGRQATLNQTTMAIRFENMLQRVDNMIKSNNIYSVWIRLDIGKDNPLTFNSASQNEDENLVMSLDFEKSGAGTANEFTFKIAFDLFNHGQVTKTRVEKLDELLYNCMNLPESLQGNKDVTELLYCKFQYGYNVTGDTQLVSPLYEGMITDIKPSINYTNGKTYYTIKGSSFVSKSSLKHNYDIIGEKDNYNSGWNGLDLVKWILWYYHGNPATVTDIGYKEEDRNNRDSSVREGFADMYNIDIPEDLRKNASNVQIDQMSDMTAIDYCKLVLQKTYNKADKRYDETKHDYILAEGEMKPYYTLYITDSGGGGVPTIHVAYIGSREDQASLNCVRKINFEFTWFTKSNNLVLNWEPEVDLVSYLITRANREFEKDRIEKEKEALLRKAEQDKQEIENKANEINNRTDFPNAIPHTVTVGPVQNGEGFYDKNYNRRVIQPYKPPTFSGVTGMGNNIRPVMQRTPFVSSASIESQKPATTNQCNADIAKYDERLRALENDNIEFYSSSITLVGIPSDIPLNIMLLIKPIIFESVSRTQGMYYVTGSRDTISTSGLFTTKIDLFRQVNY